MSEIPEAEELHRHIQESVDDLLQGLRSLEEPEWSKFAEAIGRWVERTAHQHAEEHFRKHGAEYVRQLTLETINRLFKLEE